MATNKTKPAKKTFSKVYKFAEQDGVRVSLEEDAYQHLCTFARMFMSDDPVLSMTGRERLRQVAKALASAQNEKLRASVANRPNAQQERAPRVDPDDEIRTAFDRLTREGHTPREARGILLRWDRWSESTIRRRTK
ncbi:hypothetical protein [Hydrogenophaga sp.]|uniref:hypothetical protein n=1 Tax=Hydrogenophaga sp. TaxID=1904254 RepID=UPI002FC695BE